MEVPQEGVEHSAQAKEKLEDADALCRAIEILKAQDNFFKGVALAVQALVGNSIVGIASYDEAKDLTTTAALLGLGSLSDGVSTLIGANVFEWQAKPSDQARTQMSSGRLVCLDGGLHELTYRRVPLGVCRWIEKYCGMDHIYAVGIVHEGRVYGTIAVAPRDIWDGETAGLLEALAARAGKLFAEKKRRAETGGVAESSSDGRTPTGNAAGVPPLSTAVQRPAGFFMGMRRKTNESSLPVDAVTSLQLAKQIQQIVGYAIVGVSTYDEKRDVAVLCSVVGLGTLEEAAVTLLSGPVVGHRTQGPPSETKRALQSGKLLKINGGLHETFFKRTPLGLSRWIERLSGLGAMYGMGLLDDNQLYGTVIIVFRRGHDIEDAEDAERRIKASAEPFRVACKAAASCVLPAADQILTTAA